MVYSIIIKNRPAEILLPIINQIVILGSNIVTDEWKSYPSPNKSNLYQHQKIRHKYCFVDCNTCIHTQNVESYSNKLKLAIKKMNGLLWEKKVFLQEFMYREHNADENLHL